MDTRDKNWIDWLAEEDLAFLKRFILASGSLKALAEAYGVSYPTIRLRLDRLIQKIQVVEDEQTSSDFERYVGIQFAEGKITAEVFKGILEAHRRELEGEK